MKGAAQVYVQFPVPGTSTMTAGGNCTDNVNCDNHYGFWISSRGDAWTEYNVPFAALGQQGLGWDAEGNSVAPSAAWDPSHLLRIEFSIPLSDFDVWVDDVSFYDCQGTGCVPICSGQDAPEACPAAGPHPAGCWPSVTDCSALPAPNFYPSVWGTSANDVWAGGLHGPDLTGVIRHSDGGTWLEPASAAHPIWSLRGSDSGDLWAVGDFGTILHGDGASWSPVPSPTTASLQGVWASAPEDAWAVGYGGVILRWNGADWSAASSGTTVNLWAVGGTARDDVWAVGDGGTILHWQGTAWAPATSGTAVTMNAVWSSRADDVWAVGNGATILHWNGNSWSPSPSATTNPLYGVWGSGANDVWAVGLGGTVVHYSGSTWASASSGVTVTLVGVWGNGPSDFWAVGSRSTILHFDGAGWSPAPTASSGGP